MNDGRGLDDGPTFLLALHVATAALGLVGALAVTVMSRNSADVWIVLGLFFLILLFLALPWSWVMWRLELTAEDLHWIGGRLGLTVLFVILNVAAHWWVWRRRKAKRARLRPPAVDGRGAEPPGSA